MPPFLPDIATEVAADSAHLVPEQGSADPGYILTITGADEFDWVHPPHKQILEGNGDPNGVYTASKGTLYVDRTTPALWQNSDGMTTWVAVGSGGGGSFPITYNDGTYTYTLFVSGSLVDFQAYTNASSSTNKGTVEIDPSTGSIDINAGAGANTTADLNVTAKRDLNVVANTANISATGAVNIDSGHSGGSGAINLVPTGTGAVTIDGGDGFSAHLSGVPKIDSATAAPASGDINASEFTFWLDDTPGATTFNIKAKDSSGTVRTASIPLS